MDIPISCIFLNDKTMETISTNKLYYGQVVFGAGAYTQQNAAGRTMLLSIYCAPSILAAYCAAVADRLRYAEPIKHIHLSSYDGVCMHSTYEYILC